VKDILLIIYHVVAIATTAYLTFLDGYTYTWWNWIIVIPINLSLGKSGQSTGDFCGGSREHHH